jgi:hypothetical protein
MDNDVVYLRIPVTPACRDDLAEQAKLYDIRLDDLASLLLGLGADMLMDGTMEICSEGYVN